MHEQRTMMDDSCEACHGPLQRDSDGSSFCANPARGGQQWPELNLNM
jgi:hypothetical protein